MTPLGQGPVLTDSTLPTRATAGRPPRERNRRDRFQEAAVVLGLLLLPLLFWWRLWALDPADRSVIPAGDFTDQYYPLQLFANRELAAGRLPTWDPYINAGQPGLADPQTGAFYPPNLLLNLLLALFRQPLSPGWLSAQVIFHFSLASLFTYLFVRHSASGAGARPAASRFAGAVAALCFTYAGYLTSFPVQQLTILETAVWLPLVLFFLDRALTMPRALHHAVPAALALACALLAGHPQTAMYVVYAAAGYGLFRTLSRRSGSRVSSPTAGLLSLAAVLLLAAALAAIQLAPTLLFIGRSTRAGLDYDAVAWGFPLAEMTHLLYPGYFGGSPQYVGILPPMLAVAALILHLSPAASLPGSRHPGTAGLRRQTLFWLLLGTIAFLLAFGGHTFFYNLFYLLVPGFGAVRNQERIIYLFSLAVSVLAGYGALALVQPLPAGASRRFHTYRRSLGWIAAGFAVLTALFYFGYLQGLQQGVEINMFEGALRHHVLLLIILAGGLAVFALRRGWAVRAPRRWLVALTLGLIALNLFTINWRFNLADPPPDGLYPETGLISFLRSQPGTFRISSAGLLPGGASAGIVYRLEDITANTPLRLEVFQRFEDRVDSWRRWQLLNVHYVLDRRDLDGPGLELIYQEGETRAYRLADPLPRAWVVYETLSAGDEEAIDIINAAGWDPRQAAILPPGGGHALEMPTNGGSGSAQVVTAQPGRLVLDVTSTQAGLLVASQPYYPGWRARIDGRPAQIQRADVLLQAIPVPAGSHQVELTYCPSYLPALCTLLALALGLAYWFWRRRA